MATNARILRGAPRFLIPLLAAALSLAAGTTLAEESRTVIGPTNEALYDGARLLREGDGEAGVRLTLDGLATAANDRERTAAWANLCAGYILLEQLDEALRYCDRVLEDHPDNWRSLSNRALIYIELGRYEDADRDLAIAESISPTARAVRTVRLMLDDALDPVVPVIEIDDRRRPPD